MLSRLLNSAASRFDVAVVRLAQEIAIRTVGPGPNSMERLARLQTAAKAYAGVDPGTFYAAPPPLVGVREEAVRSLPGGECVDLTWQSGWRPHEPTGRDAYLAFLENQTAHARLLRHRQPRPALVCLHGYRAGVHRLEEIAWNARWLYSLGMDVALMTLPFHARRAPRGRTAPLFPSGRIGRTIEGFGQAIWDLRSLLGWLRARGSAMAGVAGMSLGGFTAALAATVEPRIDYAMLVIPLGDLTDVAVEHEALRGRRTPPWLADAGKRALSLVGPLAREPVVPGDHMLVAAAEADRITLAATHARKLSQHFRAPLITFSGAHLIQLGRRTAFAEMARLLARRGAIPRR